MLPWDSSDRFYPSLDGGDVLSGGPDRDRADFSSHHRFGVDVALNDVADDGTWGERDNVRTDVEDVTCSRHGDFLQGSGAPNELVGGAGWDQLYGSPATTRWTPATERRTGESTADPGPTRRRSTAETP